MGKDYVYAVTTLLEDALVDRDLVHRQTACSVVKRKYFGMDGSFNMNLILLVYTYRHFLGCVWIGLRGCRDTSLEPCLAQYF